MYWYIRFLPGWSGAEIKNTVHVALPKSRHSGYSFFFNLLFLVFSYKDKIKTDINQMNDNLNEKSTQIALAQMANKLV